MDSYLSESGLVVPAVTTEQMREVDRVAIEEIGVPCAHVHSLLLTKLDGIRTRQRELATLESELEGLISRSDRLDPADCTDTQICNIIASEG